MAVTTTKRDLIPFSFGDDLVREYAYTLHFASSTETLPVRLGRHPTIRPLRHFFFGCIWLGCISQVQLRHSHYYVLVVIRSLRNFFFDVHVWNIDSRMTCMHVASSTETLPLRLGSHPCVAKLLFRLYLTCMHVASSTETLPLRLGRHPCVAKLLFRLYLNYIHVASST